MKNALKYIIVGGIFLSLFTPFVVSETLFFPFITGKAFFFRIIVEILFAAWLLLICIDRSYLPRRSVILTMIVVFMAVIGLADIFGNNFGKSFWSNFERMEGYIGWIHLFAYFLVATSVMTTRKMWSYFFHASIVLSAALSFNALGPLFESLKTGVDLGRIDGTTGNPIYLAVYNLFHISLIIFYWFKGQVHTKGLHVAYGAALAVNLLTLYYTATRGVILGLIGGFFLAILLIAIFEKKHKKLRKISIGFVGLMVVFVMSFIGMRDAQFVQDSPVLKRFADISAEDTTTKGRFLIWDMSFKGFKENPILGWGQGNFSYVFDKYYNPEMYNQEKWFDRAHNIFFDWLIAGGLLGLLAYLGLFGSALFVLWRKVNFSLVEKSLFTGLLAAYLFQNVFAFDSLMSYTLFFSILAFLHVLTFEDEGEPEVQEYSEQHVHRTKFLYGPLVIIFLITSMYTVNLKPMWAGQTFIQAIQNASASDVERTERGFELYKEALAYDTFATTEIRERLIVDASVMRGKNGLGDVAQKYVKLADDETAKQVEETPNLARQHFFRGSYLRSIADTDGAIVALERALELSPKKLQIINEFGLLHIEAGNYEAAGEALAKSFALEDRARDTRLLYAAVAVHLGDLELEKELLGELSAQSIATSQNLINAYNQTGRFNEVIKLFETRIEVNPNDLQSHLYLSRFYQNVGRVSDAKATVDVAAEVNARLLDGQVARGSLSLENANLQKEEFEKQAEALKATF
jgi:tetratricopeptide (TPR) repeat protein